MKKVTLNFEIKLRNSMALTSIWVHTSKLNKAQIDSFRKSDDPNTIKGEIEIKTTTNMVTFTLVGVGNEPGLKGTFNFTLEDKKIFSEDQEIKVNYEGRISFNKSNVKLPF